MAERNWNRIAAGDFSTESRNRMILEVLSRRRRAESPRLTLSDLAGRGRVVITRVRSQVFRDEILKYRQRAGLVDRNIVL
jgi:hypothetical protein